jgi:hypothetical protein
MDCWVPGGVVYEIVGKIAGDLAEVAPAAGIWGAAEGKAQCDEEVAPHENHRGHGGRDGVMEAPVGRLDVNLGLQDGFLWVTMAEGHDLMHVTKECASEHAWREQVVLYPVVDGPLCPFDGVERLIMSDPEFFNNLAAVVDGGLLDEAHGGYDGARDEGGGVGG